jgi:GDPmannose 4,6-dehydratase
MKKALVTGVTGQDGAYLSRLLLDKGYAVYGAVRRTSSSSSWRLSELDVLGHSQFQIVDFDLTDASNCIRLVGRIRPDEIYNLAAQSFVALSFDQPIVTSEATGIGAVNLLEAIRIIDPGIRYYQASSSEMFGKVQSIPQDESTPFYPRSPYGVAKLFAHWMTVNYRESYGIFATSGILFNHESPLRGIEFVTRKISDGIAKIKLGKLEHLELGNLDAKRDWGFAGDYVDGMWRMLQADTPGNYVLATNRTESVRTFVELACKAADINVEWDGADENARGIDKQTGNTIIRVNPAFYRPAEVDLLIGNAEKARQDLDWTPSMSLEELSRMMVARDIERNERGQVW